MFQPDRYSFIPPVKLSARAAILLSAIVGLTLVVVLSTSLIAHGGGRVELSFGYGPRVQVISADGPRAVQFESSSLSTPVTVTLHSLTLDQLLERYSAVFTRDSWSSTPSDIPVQGLPLIKRWTQPLGTAGKDWYGTQQETIVPATVPPGLYVLSIDHALAEADDMLLIISPYTLMLKHSRDQLAVWASAPQNEPIGNLRVRAFDADHALVAEGVTDAQGRWVTPLPTDRTPQIVIGEKNGFITLAGLSHDWEFDNWTWWWHPEPIKQLRSQVYLYTDRPIYRPGQTVYVKAWARYDNDAIYSRIPLEWDVIVRLRDARDNVIETQTLHVNEFGTLTTSFGLAEGGTLGEYHIETQIKDDVFRQSFKVEEYRKPEYEVTVNPDRVNVIGGQPLTVTVEARTYFGAPLVGAKIDLNVLTRSYETWWYDDDEAHVIWQTLSADETGVTDEQGRWVGSIRPRVTSFSDYRHVVPILIEATVQDSSNQSVSAHASAIVHEAAIAFTPALVKHYFHPNEPIPVSLFARDIDGQPRANVPVTAELLGYVYGEGFAKSIGRVTGRTDAQGGVTLNLTANEQDWYRVRVTGVDRNGKTIERFTWMWVYDPSRHTPWHAAEADQKLEISTDRDAYISGDTAQLMIRTPVSGKALLTVERGTLRRAQMIELTSPVTLLPLTLQDDDAPNVYITVNVYRPPILKNYQVWQSMPDAELLVARVNVPVSADQRRLRISVTPDRSSYALRDTASLTVQVADQSGQPVKAELSLALVDEAIFALSQDQTPDPFEVFYAQRGAAVRTFNSFAPVRWLPCECGGGGGGENLLANPRFNFPDTAYWNSRIVTDQEGRAVVQVTLPDSLTRWRAVVRATTADEFPRVGEATAAITITQPIVIRPVLPRQVVQNDRVLISAIVHNNTDRDRTAAVWADLINGTRINTDNTALITHTVTISASGSIVVGWPIEVQTLGAMTVTLRAKSDRYADAVQVSIPIETLAVPEITSITANTTSSAEHSIELPANTIQEVSTLQIDLSPSIAASILDGLAYLTGYPYGCVEQTMSKALPNAVVGRAFTALGVIDPLLKADLPRKVSAGLQRLYGYQHNDGGWGWWFDDSTDDYQTAYVLFGLAMTKQAGYEVDQGVIDRGAKYLTERLPSIGDERTRAYALFALAMNGKGDLTATRALMNDSTLDAFSRAGIAIALHELGDDELAQDVVDRLISDALMTNGEVYWNTGDKDGHYHEKTMSSSMRSTALALDAIVRIRPNDPIVSKIVRWLMAQRAPDGWGTTQETAYAVVALTDYLRASGELNSGSTYRVYVNDQLVEQGTLSGRQIQQTIRIPATQLRDGANRIRLERDRSGGQLYYKITQHALIAGSTDRAAGLIGVTRTYRDPKSNKLITAVQPGDVIKVAVKVTMPDDGWYVAIEDPLLGGLEGVNERLNTTSFAAKQQGYGDERDEFFYQDYGYNNKEIHDDRVVFFVTHLGKGTHTFTYLARATQTGTFNALPAQVYLMYSPEVWGRSVGGLIRVGEVSAPSVSVSSSQIARAEKVVECSGEDGE
jgi:uncharacterized protein YfaS (alpha-2-macroglobulin family)